MKPDLRPRSIVLLLGVVAVLYAGVYWGIEHWRRYKGPWEVEFLADTAGQPSIVVRHPKLRVHQARMIFLGERLPLTNFAARVRFDRPLQAVPFGRVIYEDLTALPGVVTFDLFGHEIELLPRVLVVNRRLVPWQSQLFIELAPTNKPADPPKPPKGWPR